MLIAASVFNLLSCHMEHSFWKTLGTERNYKREIMSLCNNENRTRYTGIIEVSAVSQKSPGQTTHFENY